MSFARPDGADDIVDFRWEQRQELRTLRLLGEFDGHVKYTRGEFMRGRSIDNVVWDEKIREDRLRATDHGMARWIWSVALRIEAMRSLLLRAGLRPER